MNPDPTKKHWEKVWSQKQPEETSWYQDQASMSLAMIGRSGLLHSERLIDVGGGASMLTAGLLEAGYRDITVLDVSGAALRRAQKRLGPKAENIEWIQADVRAFEAPRLYSLWHDRAVFHFLTEPADQALYVCTLKRSVKPNGRLVIATFAPGGPKKCSGLDIVQHDAGSLQALLGANWRLLEEQNEVHKTPAGNEQKFGFYRFERQNTQP